jgi:hypothetical protein
MHSLIIILNGRPSFILVNKDVQLQFCVFLIFFLFIQEQREEHLIKLDISHAASDTFFSRILTTELSLLFFVLRE